MNKQPINVTEMLMPSHLRPSKPVTSFKIIKDYFRLLTRCTNHKKELKKTHRRKVRAYS